LQIGTQAGDILAIQINSTNTADIGSVIVKGDAVQTALRVGDLVINGAAIAPSKSDGLSTEYADASAIAIANAINTSGTDADVQAAANPTITDTVNFEASANSGGVITINGVETTLISITNSLNSNVENAIVAINDIKSETGVEASADLTGKLVLTAADGRNITVNYGPGIDNTDLGAVAAGTVTSSITLTSSSPITIGGSSPDHAGLIGGTTSTLVPLSSPQLDTQANAVASLAIIDGSLDTVSNLRANLGALENRLYSMIDNLGNNSVNLMDAKSQIMDTDFAIEMANFAKLQILQQASTTMLAQANAQPQSILKLLQ